MTVVSEINYDRYFEKVIVSPSREGEKEQISLMAGSYIIIDYRDNHILYGSNYDTEQSIASTTKILTAIIAIELDILDEEVEISSYAAGQPEVKLGIYPGEKYYMRDLIYAMMLGSYNDVAVAIAEHIGKTVEAFSVMMNEKAISIGAKNSSFVTPNGLEAEGHYSTAADMVKLAGYAMKNECFMEIVNSTQYSFNEITKAKAFVISNINKYIYQNEAAIGVKTGYTGKAGYCFVGATRFGNTILINTLLASGWPPNKNYKWQDTNKLVEYVKKNFEERNIVIPEWRLCINNEEIVIGEIGWEYLSDGYETLTEVIHFYPDYKASKGESEYEVSLYYDNVVYKL